MAAFNTDIFLDVILLIWKQILCLLIYIQVYKTRGVLKFELDMSVWPDVLTTTLFK